MAQLIPLKMRMNDRPAPHTGRHGTPMVINLAAFRKVWLGGQQGEEFHPISTSLRMIRRIKEVLNEEYRSARLSMEAEKALSEIRRRFIHLLQITPYQRMVEEGYVNHLLDDYLGLLIVADDQHTSARQYIDEREYYYHHPQEVKDVALQMKYVVLQN